MATTSIGKSIFDPTLGVTAIQDSLLTRPQADWLFQFFRDAAPFNWEDKNNNCEDRAHAICLALNTWQIPAYKGWVFSGSFLKRNVGQLQNNWGYHVATLVGVTEANHTNPYILDPAMANGLITLNDWAEAVTDTPASFHCITVGEAYIFDPVKISSDTWFLQNKQNYKWTMQGLAGINGVTRTGKAQLVFRKQHIKTWQRRFEELVRHKPALLAN